MTQIPQRLHPRLEHPPSAGPTATDKHMRALDGKSKRDMMEEIAERAIAVKRTTRAALLYTDSRTLLTWKAG
jgi:hypothetical protein